MALKTLLMVALLFAAIAVIAVPMAQAQGILSGLLGLIRIQGILYCTANGNIGVNGTSTPVFPNALVQLQCGGRVVSSTLTNGRGVFSILLDPLSAVLSTLLSGCNLAVNTPLATCNSSLPSVGGLISTLQNVGSTLVGLLNITNLMPLGFAFNANMNN